MGTVKTDVASFGVARFPQHGANVADFLKAAGRALYRAKQAGAIRCARRRRGRRL